MLKATCSGIKWENLKSPDTTTVKINSSSGEAILKALIEAYEDKPVSIQKIEVFDDIWCEEEFDYRPYISGFKISDDEFDDELLLAIAEGLGEENDE